MNSLTHLDQLVLSFLGTIVLVCSGLLPSAHAVSPPPDGGYPGGNTAEGDTALLSLTSGQYNTAIGYLSLRTNSANSFNTAIGAGTLLANVADQNTAVGAAALLSNTTGSFNTANGALALVANSSGTGNTATGAQALQANTIGSFNTADGVGALFENITGAFNTAIGISALAVNSTGSFNTATGDRALSMNDVGNGNTAMGHNALQNNTASGNTALGYNAGTALTNGSNNIDIGADVTGAAADANTIRIGNPNIATTIIRGISGTPIVAGGTVYVDSTGMLGTIVSSRRFKEQITPKENSSEALYLFKPVTFRYKHNIDPAGTQQFGLIAEEVERISRDLVVRDDKGKPYSVRYDQVNAMLLNEFLKEHRHLQEQDAIVARQQKQIDALTAGLQKVSAELELSKATPQTVLNHR